MKAKGKKATMKRENIYEKPKIKEVKWEGVDNRVGIATTTSSCTNACGCCGCANGCGY